MYDPVTYLNYVTALKDPDLNSLHHGAMVCNDDHIKNINCYLSFPQLLVV